MGTAQMWLLNPEILLMSGDLNGVVKAKVIRQTLKTIKQNLFGHSFIILLILFAALVC
jgi:cation transport ATPase